MLAVPMLTQRGDVLGVLFFINRKSVRSATIRTVDDADRYVRPYTDRQVRLAHSLASMAAVSMEATQLHDQIEQMLESFEAKSPCVKTFSSRPRSFRPYSPRRGNSTRICWRS